MLNWLVKIKEDNVPQIHTKALYVGLYSPCGDELVIVLPEGCESLPTCEPPQGTTVIWRGKTFPITYIGQGLGGRVYELCIDDEGRSVRVGTRLQGVLYQDVSDDELQATLGYYASR